ncbi:MAG: hypothetical protein QNJ51_14290 [Calothrix sp. MO_167.B12]|nr:hypothetical protein [Calothrix sp. MO_167.B12]
MINKQQTKTNTSKKDEIKKLPQSQLTQLKLEQLEDVAGGWRWGTYW